MASKNTNKSSGNSFADSLRGVADRVYGENGALKEGKTDYPHIQGMSDSIRSGTAPTESELRNARQWFQKMLDYAVKNRDPVAARDAVVALWAKRHRTDGEGEKAISLEWFFVLHKGFPRVAVDLVRADLFGLFGCYQDYNRLLEMISVRQTGSEANDGLTTLSDEIRKVLLDVRTRDLRKLDGFLKLVSVVEGHGHWANRGIKGFESLPGDPVGGEDGRSHVLRKYMETVSESKDVPDGDGTRKVYPYLDRVKANSGKNVHLPELSLVGKWVGSEGAKYARTVRIVQRGDRGNRVYDNYLNYMIRGGMKSRGHHGPIPFPVDQVIPNGAKKQWRLRNTALRAALGVTEVLMTARRFAEINFGHVCSRCLKLNSKAFLNELRKKAPASHEESTGNRHPSVRDRVDARRNLRGFFNEKGAEKLNAAGLFPHEIGYQAGVANSTADRDLHNTLWEAKKLEIQKALEKVRTELVSAAEAGDGEADAVQKAMTSGMWLPCSDTSGSMTWGNGGYSSALTAPNRPWDVSVGLGAFMAQCSAGPWNGLCLTFDSDPQIFDVKGMNASDAMNKITGTSRGYTTDFRKAMMTVLDHMVSHRVPEGEEPVLVVYSDGEFDDGSLNPAGSRGWETTYEWLVKQYSRKGRTRLPLIVWWNLKSERAGVQTKDHCPGVMHLQSKSPALFKYILYGESMPDTVKEVVVDGKVVKMKTSSVTPYLGFRKVVDQALWAPVDEVLVRSMDGIFSDFHGMPTKE